MNFSLPTYFKEKLRCHILILCILIKVDYIFENLRHFKHIGTFLIKVFFKSAAK